MGNKQARAREERLVGVIAGLDQGAGNNGGGAGAVDRAKDFSVKHADDLDVPGELRLAGSFAPYVNDKAHSDVAFVVGPGKKKMYGHRLLLAARSGHFRKLFFEQTGSGKEEAGGGAGAGGNEEDEEKEKEKESKPKKKKKAAPAPTFDEEGRQIVALPYVAESVFSVVLDAMYTDRAHFTPHTVPQILAVAQQYDVPSVVAACSRFMSRGMTKENALATFAVADDAALPFIEEHAEEILRQPAFLELPPKKVVSLVRSENLRIQEVELWRRVVRWGEETLYRSKTASHLEEGPEGLRVVLRDVLPHIRFPVMSLAEVATEVAPVRVLPAGEQLALCRYAAAKGTPLEEGMLAQLRRVTPFICEARKQPSIRFKFDRFRKQANAVLTEDNMFARTNANRFSIVCGDKLLSDGVMYFELEVVELNLGYGNRNSIWVGTVNNNVHNWEANSPPGYRDNNGGTLCITTGQVYKNRVQHRVLPNPHWARGDIVGVRLIADKDKPNMGTMEVFRGERSMGIVYRNILTPIRPVVVLYGNGNAVRLKMK